MNKKFSTLVAGVLLATSFGTVNAQLDKAGKYETGKSYVLGWFDGDSAIAVTGTRADGFTLKSVKTSTLTTLALTDSALWTVVVTPAVGGGSPKYTYVNKATQLPLAVSKADTLGTTYKALPLGGSLAEWGNLKSVISADSAALTSYFTTTGKPDSVVYFAQVGKNLVLRTEQADKMPVLAAGNGANPIGIAPYLAKVVTLNAKDLNTKLGTVEPDGSFKLKFTPDVTDNASENLFTKYDLIAVDPVGGSTFPANNHVRLQAKDQKVGNAQAYLFVDTAYYVGTESAGKLLKFALDSASFTSGAALNADGKALRDTLSAYFQFKYSPVNDSLSITVAKVNHKGAQAGTTGTAWNYAADGTTSLTWGAKNTTGVPADSVIRLAKLSAVTELTVGATPSNTKITIGTAANSYVPTTMAEGVYLLKLNTTVAGRENGTYYVMGLDSLQKYSVQEASQNFMHMPAAQWYVTKTSSLANSPVTITNREFTPSAGSIVNNVYASNVQLYAAGNNVFTFNGDTLSFVPVTAELLGNRYLGYKRLTKEELALDVYALNYYHGLNKNTYVNTLDAKDSLLFVDANEGEKVWFAMELVKDTINYGSNNTKELLAKNLYRSSYRLKVKDSNKLENDGRYVTLGANGKYVVSELTTEAAIKAKASVFFLKENNYVTEGDKHFYALIDTCKAANGAQLKVGVADDALNLKGEKISELRTSAFFVDKDDNPIYRRFNTALESVAANDAPDTLKFYTVNSANHEYLYEDAGSKYSKGLNNAAGKNINFLGLEGKGVNAKAAMYVDTAWVRGNTPMPQYMLVVGANVVGESNICPDHGIDDGHPQLYPAYVAGRFLINAQDSVSGAANKTAANYVWEKKYTRLAFVPAIHRGDSLYILKNESLTKAGAKFSWEDLNTKIADNKYVSNIIDMKKDGNAHKNYKFSFRLINDEADKSFLIESEGDDIKPTKEFGWVKIQNGVPVIAKGYVNFGEAFNQAEKFNVESTNEKPVANEGIETTEVSVIAGAGQVVINNAAGKTVAISNILGQTIANTVLASDNATIAVPAGIVVVAVEGESAVKAIVK